MTSAKVKDSWAFYALYGSIMSMMGYYMTTLRGSEPASRPTPDPSFDMDRFSKQPWYSIMMTNDLPFFIDECQQRWITSTSYSSRAYNTKTGSMSVMDRGFRCSNWNAGDC